jgi:hypothetical protein
MGISEYRPDTYEVGITLPDNQQDAKEVLERLKEFNEILDQAASSSASGLLCLASRIPKSTSTAPT